VRKEEQGGVFRFRHSRGKEILDW